MSEQITVVQYLRLQGEDPFEIQPDGRPLHECMTEVLERRVRELGLVPVPTDRLVWDEAQGALVKVLEHREAPTWN